MGRGVYPPEILIIYLSKHPSPMFGRCFTIGARCCGYRGYGWGVSMSWVNFKKRP